MQEIMGEEAQEDKEEFKRRRVVIELLIEGVSAEDQFKKWPLTVESV